MAPSATNQEELKRLEIPPKRKCEGGGDIQQKRPRIVTLDTQAERSNPGGPQHCQQCGFECWLCSVVDGASPGHEDPGRWWSPEESEPNRFDMKALPPPATDAPGTALQSTQLTRRTSKDSRYITTKHSSFPLLLENANIILGDWLAQADPDAVLPQQSRPLNSVVFIDLSDDELAAISEQVTMMGLRGYQEFEIRLYLSQVMIFRDQIPRGNEGYPVPEGSGSVKLSLRRDFWRPGRKGPTIEPDSPVLYDFTSLTPDTTYMASLSDFAWKARGVMVHRTILKEFVADPRSNGCCPYLTMEFKSGLPGASIFEARNQIAAASAIWLVHRKALRLRVVDAPDCSDLRHYGVVFTPAVIEIWEAKMDGDLIKLAFLAKADPCVADGLGKYIRWSNAIHSWGLNENFESFKADMEAYMRKEGVMSAVEAS